MRRSCTFFKNSPDPFIPDGPVDPGGADVPGGGWPADLGQPATTGSQNNLRYAYFPATRRLAIAHGANGVVVKPLDPLVLIAIVEEKAA